jgi:hypothetical protein
MKREATTKSTMNQFTLRGRDGRRVLTTTCKVVAMLVKYTIVRVVVVVVVGESMEPESTVFR